MLQIKDQIQTQIQNWVPAAWTASWKSARKTWLNPASLLHGLRWLELSPGHSRLVVYPNWLGFQTSRFTGALTLACELAVDEALKECEHLAGISTIFMGSESEFHRADRGTCEVRFKVDLDEVERLRVQVLEQKTLRHEFSVTLWSLSNQQVGQNRLTVELQLRPYLTGTT